MANKKNPEKLFMWAFLILFVMTMVVTVVFFEPKFQIVSVDSSYIINNSTGVLR